MIVRDPGDFPRLSQGSWHHAPCPDCGARSGVRAIETPSGHELFVVLLSTVADAANPEALLQGLKVVALQSGFEDWTPVTLTWYSRKPLSVSERAKLSGVTAGTSATTFLDLPPSCSQCCLALHAHLAVSPASGPSLPFQPLSSGLAGVTGNIVTGNLGERHLRLANLEGRADGSFEEECAAIFEQLHEVLGDNGFAPSDLVRTWLYLRSIPDDYEVLNAVRRDAFQRWGLNFYPASTGVGGSPRSNGARCALSLYAVSGLEESSLKILSAGSFNEAQEYGSYFARGLQLDIGRLRRTLISGTAAIGSDGETVGVGDLDAQVAHTLVNVEGLLNAAGSGFEDALSVISYLKPGQDVRRYRQLIAEKLPEAIPHLVVEAELCRDDLLCETELIAYLGL